MSENVIISRGESLPAADSRTVYLLNFGIKSASCVWKGPSDSPTGTIQRSLLVLAPLQPGVDHKCWVCFGASLGTPLYRLHPNDLADWRVLCRLACSVHGRWVAYLMGAHFNIVVISLEINHGILVLKRLVSYPHSYRIPLLPSLQSWFRHENNCRR